MQTLLTDSLGRVCNFLLALQNFIQTQKILDKTKIFSYNKCMNTPESDQADRDARIDLCVDCKPADHPSCDSLDPNCTCCKDTLDQM